MRHTKDPASKPISEDLLQRLYHALEQRYPGKVWRVLEVCPGAVVKTIDNEADALETLRRLEEAKKIGAELPMPMSVSPAVSKRTSKCDGSGQLIYLQPHEIMEKRSACTLCKASELWIKPELIDGKAVARLPAHSRVEGGSK